MRLLWKVIAKNLATCDVCSGSRCQPTSNSYSPPLGGNRAYAGRVQVEGRVVRRFHQGPVGTFPALVEAWAVSGRGDPLCLVFPETPADLELRSGRPRQLPWRQLREQLRRREKGGQRAREYEAALAERAATPVHVIPAALAAFGLTLKLQRPRRRLPLAGAVALGMGLSMVLWAASVIAHAIAVSGALEPWTAAAIPGLASALIAALTLWRA